jgi:hypothetical protein
MKKADTVFCAKRVSGLLFVSPKIGVNLGKESWGETPGIIKTRGNNLWL